MSLNKKIMQHDLRKAMNEHKKKHCVPKKIESRLAKYTDSGQLMCILCRTIVRSETVWSVHLNSKVHKENIALAKKTKLETECSTKISEVSTFKRPISPSENTSVNKKIKGILKNSNQSVTQAKSSIPVDFFDNMKQTNGVPAPSQISENEISVPNIMDVQNIEIEEEQEKDTSVKDTNIPALPEGFFDDPVMDAKIRNVEYKDPIEEEWERFQKEIKEGTAQSAQIIADDQEEATKERQLDEIEEQIRYYSRVMDLVKLKEQMVTNRSTGKNDENVDDNVSSEEENEAEFEEFIDWRAKSSYK